MNRERPRVRAATDEDLPRLAELLAPLPLFARYGLDVAVLRQRWSKARRAGEGLLVAEHGGRLVGVCGFLPEGTFATGAYLRTLAVAPDAQGRGVGTALLAEFEAACAAAPGGWFLLASDFNDGARRFYERHGYRVVGALPSFAAPGVSERVLWKPRPPQG